MLVRIAQIPNLVDTKWVHVNFRYSTKISLLKTISDRLVHKCQCQFTACTVARLACVTLKVVIFFVYFLIPFIRVLYPFLSSFFPRRFAVPFPSIQPARKSTTMKFSLAAASAVLLTTFASLARADEYADAIKEWCQGAYPLLLIRFDLNRKLTFFSLSFADQVSMSPIPPATLSLLLVSRPKWQSVSLLILTRNLVNDL